MKKVKIEKPKMLIGSPPCTAYSTWQYINDRKRDQDVVAWEKKRAVIHLSFCVDLYLEQIRGGRYFVHEHPAGCTSWAEEVMQRLMKRADVEYVVMDQCQFGADDGKGNPIRKPKKMAVRQQRGAPIT